MSQHGIQPATKIANAAGKLAEGNGAALAESGHASTDALHELTKAYQEMAARNAKNLTTAMQELSAVKDPAAFFALQQKLIKDGVEAAVADAQKIAQLTAAVFTAAFDPVKKQIDSVHTPKLN